MTAKLDIYRKFTNALAVAVLLSVGWICYEVILEIVFMMLPIYPIYLPFFLFFFFFFLSLGDEKLTTITIF